MKLLQRYQLWYVLGSDELGAASAQCSEVKTPLDIYLQRHSPLSPDLWLHYSRLSARYISRHVPGADISLYPVSSYLSKWIKPGAK